MGRGPPSGGAGGRADTPPFSPIQPLKSPSLPLASASPSSLLSFKPLPLQKIPKKKTNNVRIKRGTHPISSSGDEKRKMDAQYNPRTVEEVFRDFKGRRAGLVRALTAGTRRRRRRRSRRFF